MKRTGFLIALWGCALLGAKASGMVSIGKKLTEWYVQSSARVQATGDVVSTPRADMAGWYAASVPSTLMGVLVSNGVEPEPLTAADYQHADRSQFETSWWYRTTFTLPRQAPDKHVILSFDGINYRANIWLNGHQIATARDVAGPFRQFSFDITPYAQPQNVLAVELFRAQPGEPNIGFVDWNPRPADESMGIFREVTVKTCGGVTVGHTAVQSKVNAETLQEAWLTIVTELTNHTNATVHGTLVGTMEGQQFTTDVTLAPHERRQVHLVTDAHISHPRLWWCHNMGKPELYDLNVTFHENGKTTDCETLRFGIREVKSRLTADGYRQFSLNGRDILLRGAGWTDDIYLRDTPETNRRQLEYVRDMNMNTVRLEGFWGTSQSLYDLCDELGLLILVGWSCQWEWEEYLGSPVTEPYGGITSPENMALVAESFEHQVLWLRHHPSIIGWFVGSDRIPMPELEQCYNRFLAANDDRCYIISAKKMESSISGLSGTKMGGPYEYVGPSYWYSNLGPGSAFGFNTETGIGAQLPVRESLEKMLGGQILPVDERWNILCTASASAMNSPKKLTEVMDARFGVSTDAETFLHRADLLNYESTRAMFEAFRVNVPQTTGIIQWMLNAARPSIYWQLYDYYMQPNAAYYAVRRANAPIQLIYDYRQRAVLAVNETLEPAELKAYMQTVAPDMYTTRRTTVTVQPGQVVKAFDVVTHPAAGTFIFLQATDAEDHELTATEYFLPDELDDYDWGKTDWTTTPIVRYASYRSLDELPSVSCEATVRCVDMSANRYEVTLRNPSKAVAFFIRLAARDAAGGLLCPVFWSDNYVTLAPGQQRTITCTLPTAPEKPATHITLEGWNVQNTSIELCN